MELFSKDIQSMDDLFVHTLRDIYYAEKQIVKALPEMIEKAHDPQLKQGFQSHLRETENHVKRLDQVFERLGKGARSIPGDRRHHRRGRGSAGEVEDETVLDAALIGRGGDYEMARTAC